MLNQKSFLNTKFTGLFTSYEYAPSIYFMTPYHERIECFFCIVSDYISPTDELILEAYEENELELVMELSIKMGELNRYEIPRINQHSRLHFSVGSFAQINLVPGLSISLRDEVRFTLNTQYFNMKYYEKQINRQFEKYTSVFDGE